MILSIYGTNLGPASGCIGQADPHQLEPPSPLLEDQRFINKQVYPKELCGVQVLVGGIPAGLLYVQDRQINFKVPRETGITGTTGLQVVYEGQASLSVTLPLGVDTVKLSLESPAYVGMPVWIDVQGGNVGRLHYPFDVRPANFKCSEVQVKRDGKALMPGASGFSQTIGGITFAGPPCGSLAFASRPVHTGRLPLHLQYRFDQPGMYEIRYILHEDFSPGSPALVTSAWTPIEIQPAGAHDRERWLEDLSAHAPKDPASLLTDYLPSILGVPDRESLQLLGPYLYDPDRTVRGYAMYGLIYWPREQAKAAVLQWLRAKGPSDMVVRFLTNSAVSGDTILAASIPFLGSNSPVLVRGAVIAFSQVKASPETRSRAARAMIERAGHIVAIADKQTVIDYVSALGSVKDPRARDLLWSFVERNIGKEQAATALAWKHVPSDLPKLARLAVDSDWRNFPYALRVSYGEAALPYLEKISRESSYAEVREEAGREMTFLKMHAGAK